VCCIDICSKKCSRISNVKFEQRLFVQLTNNKKRKQANDYGKIRKETGKNEKEHLKQIDLGSCEWSFFPVSIFIIP